MEGTSSLQGNTTVFDAGVASQIAAALKAAEQRGTTVRGGDAALYIALRDQAYSVQSRNPGIVQQSGFVTEISQY